MNIITETMDFLCGTNRDMESRREVAKTSVRKIMPGENVIGSSVGDHVYMTVKHPDGSYEHVRDLDQEKEWEEQNATINNRRQELREALRTRIITDAEMTDVLSMGTKLFQYEQMGFGQPYYPKERESSYLFLLNTQAAIRKLNSPQ